MLHQLLLKGWVFLGLNSALRVFLMQIGGCESIFNSIGGIKLLLNHFQYVKGIFDPFPSDIFKIYFLHLFIEISNFNSNNITKK